MLKVLKRVMPILAVSNLALAGTLPPCDEVKVKVADPDSIITRVENSILTDIPARVAEFAKGNNTHMGIWYEVKGTGKCVKDASYEKIYPAIPMGANCVVEAAQGIAWNFAELGKDIATGTIEAVGNVFDVDAAGLGKMGNEFVEEKLEAMKAKPQRHWGDLILGGGLHFIDWMSTLLKMSTMGIGTVLKGIAVRIEALFMIPKDIIEQTIHIAQHAWIGDREAIDSSLNRIGWRIANSPKALIMGCEPGIPEAKDQGAQK